VSVSIFTMRKSTDFEASLQAFVSPEIPPILLHTGSDEERVIMWRHCLKLFAARPFLGWGTGTWRFEAPRNGLKGFYEGYATRFYLAPHNDFFQAAAETGIVGLSFYLTLIGLFVLAGLKNIKVASNWTDATTNLIWVSSLGCWLVISFFGFPASQLVTLLMFLLVGAMIASDPKETVSAKTRFLFLPTIAVFGLVLGSIAIFSLSAIRFRSEARLANVFELIKTNDWKSCLASVQKAENRFYQIESTTTTPVAFYAAQFRFNEGDLKGAIADMERAYSIHPFHPQVLFNLAAYYQADGNLLRAEAMYRELIFTFPDFAEAGVNLAELLLETGRKAEGAFLLQHFGPSVDFRWVRRLETKYLAK
jgi:tetratricopeptide (TPR) repeat protein